MEASRHLSWKAVLLSGLIAGAIFLLLEVLLVPLLGGGSAWGPPRMMAAILMGPAVLTPATFELGIFVVGLLVHFALSIGFAVAISLLVRALPLGAALGVGALFGLGLYLFNFYVMTGVFPWFANARNWISVSVHLVFGLCAAGAYKALAREHRRPGVSLTRPHPV